MNRRVLYLICSERIQQDKSVKSNLEWHFQVHEFSPVTKNVERTVYFHKVRVVIGGVLK